MLTRRMRSAASQTTNAMTREKKEQTVKKLKEKLEASTAVFSIKFGKLDVRA